MKKLELHWTERLTLTADEVAAITGLSRSGVYDMINDGRLPHVTMNDRILVMRETLVAYLKERECLGRTAKVATLQPRTYTSRRQR